MADDQEGEYQNKMKCMKTVEIAIGLGLVIMILWAVKIRTGKIEVMEYFTGTYSVAMLLILIALILVFFVPVITISVIEKGE